MFHSQTPFACLDGLLREFLRVRRFSQGALNDRQVRKSQDRIGMIGANRAAAGIENLLGNGRRLRALALHGVDLAEQSFSIQSVGMLRAESASIEIQGLLQLLPRRQIQT